MTAPEPTPRRVRHDVQGLRAVAVLAVLAAHAGVPFLAGGFVGVDVFFVISGYLISRLLFSEVRRNGRVSLRSFYARRARRILPAATLVTVVTVVASVAWMSVVDALEVVRDAWWSIFFAANVRFADTGTDYFAQARADSPLQHFWSLAVEEQFYLVWPLVVLGLTSLAAFRGRWRFVTLAVVVLASASLAYAVQLTSTNPSGAYFSTPARAWELLAGALAALVAPVLAARWTPLLRNAAGLVGLGAVAAACVAYGPSTPFPGPAALLPVLGTALLLLAGSGTIDSERASWAARLLGIRPLRAVGDWSYSLYLWHWPLLVLPASALGRSLTTAETVAAIAAALVLSWATYRWVETPCRLGTWGRGEAKRPLRARRGLVLYPVSVALVAVTCLTAATYGQNAAERDGDAITVDRAAMRAAGVDVSDDPTVALVQASVLAAREHRPLPAALTPDPLTLREDLPDLGECDYTVDDERDLCPRGAADATSTMVVLGNSHARMWIAAFDRIAEQAGIRVYYLVKPGCSPAIVTSGLQTGEREKEPYTACNEFRDWAIDQIGAITPDLVVVSSTPPGPFVIDDDGRAYKVSSDNTRPVFEGYGRLFNQLSSLTPRTVLIRDVPRIARAADECLTSGDADLGSCMSPPQPEREALTDASVDAAAIHHVEVVDPRPWLCWQDECPAVVGDVVSYRDHDHLTSAYTGQLAPDLGRALGLWVE